MQYKSIIFDIDGTAVPLASNTASPRLQVAIAAAQKRVKVAAATGRSYGVAKPIFVSLGLTAPSVMTGGSVIMDPVTDDVLWSKPMSLIQTKQVVELLKGYEYARTTVSDSEG